MIDRTLNTADLVRFGFSGSMRSSEFEETTFRTQICTEFERMTKAARESNVHSGLIVLASKKNRTHQMAFDILARTASDGLSPIMR